MHRELSEERIERQLKKIVWFVVGAGVLLAVGGLLFTLIFSRMSNRAVLEQMHVETEEYSKRLYDQIDSDYQIMDTFASIIGSSGAVEREDIAYELQNEA